MLAMMGHMVVLDTALGIRALSRRHCRKNFWLAAAAEKKLAKPAWPNFFSGLAAGKKFG